MDRILYPKFCAEDSTLYLYIPIDEESEIDYIS